MKPGTLSGSVPTPRPRRLPARQAISLTAMAWAASTCAGSSTEIVLRIDSDTCAGNAEAPLELVRVELARDDGEPLWQSDFRVDRFTLPGEVALQPADDNLDAPVRIAVTGVFRRDASGSVQDPLRREFRVRFVRQERALLSVFLANRCRNGAVRCRAGFTCGRARCEAVDQPLLPGYVETAPELRSCAVDPPVLPMGDGGVDVPAPPRDAPAPPGDAPLPPTDQPLSCAPPRLRCNGACVDPQTSTQHCGRCGNLCGAGQSCITGACDVRETGFGGTLGFGPATQCFSDSDDGAWNGMGMASPDGGLPVLMTAAFPRGINFFDQRFEEFFVNNNGNISFLGPVGDFVPRDFPLPGRRMIAPLWSDVDTRNRGDPARNQVCFGIDATRIAVTWHNVERFAQRADQVNSFQLVLRRVPEGAVDDWDAEFRYARCEWVVWDPPNADAGAFGGPARAGINAGDNARALNLPFSGSRERLRELCSGSNVGRPGIWVIRSRGGRLQP